jgi:2-hydroxychromene-2-carboxylate isomerase
MNSTPADSNARRIAKSLALVSAVWFSFSSARRMVATLSADAAAAEHGAAVAYHPFRILELMKIVGNRPTTIECRNKSKYAGADLQRWTRRYKVDFARNPYSKTFDFAELDRGALVAIEDGRGAEYVTAVFVAIWCKPEDLSQRSVLIDAFSADVIGFVSFSAKSSVSTAALASSFVIGLPRGDVGKADMQ